MARILAISSAVARGHVGLAAIVPALQRLGHDVTALPTMLLSNHPGHAHFAHCRVEPADLGRMLDSLDANGWLEEIDAVLTGYLPTREHVAFAASAIERARARNASVLVCCDPILGDDPKGLYIDERAAMTIRDKLLSIADVVTPNRFELAWLSGHTVDGIESAIAAARSLPAGCTLATSIPAGMSRLASLLVEGERAYACTVLRLAEVPHGTGDLMTALYLGTRLNGVAGRDCLATSASGVEAAITASLGAGELRLVASAEAWSKPKPLPVRTITPGEESQ
jgi:pyridoxine kinase